MTDLRAARSTAGRRPRARARVAPVTRGQPTQPAVTREPRTADSNGQGAGDRAVDGVRPHAHEGMPRHGGRYPSIVDAIGHTPLVEIPGMCPNPNVRLYAKLEFTNPTGSLKD